MAGMREIRERIASVSEIMKITNAMYLISSSNLKKAKKRLENTEPYFEKLQSTIHHILLHTPEFEHKYFDQREGKSLRTNDRLHSGNSRQGSGRSL